MPLFRKITGQVFRRGQTSKEHPGMVFLRYRGSNREEWVTPDALEVLRSKQTELNARMRAKPDYHEKRRAYYHSTLKHDPKYKRAKKEYSTLNKGRWAEQNRLSQQKYWKSPKGRINHRRAFLKNKAKINAWRKKNRLQNLERIARVRRAYIERNRDRIREFRRERNTKIRSTPEGRLQHNYATRIAIACRQQGTVKSTRTIKLLGCTAQFFRGWLEAHFEPGMTWENYGNHAGTWQVDHVFPIAAFDLSVPEQLSKAFHYTNCKPMWTALNHAKSDALPDGTRARDNRIIPFKAA